MLNVLLKKQLKEYKYMYFNSRKRNGKTATKKDYLLRGLLFAVLYVTLLSSFFGISYLFLDELAQVNYDWLYFAFMISISFGLSMIGNLFFAYSNLYKAKDNEQLLSLPIKTKDILLSKMIVGYINCLIFESIVFIPTAVCYLINYFSFRVLALSIITFFVLGLFVLVLSNLIGFVMSKLSKYFHNKAYLSMIFTIVFLVGYYYVCFKFEAILENLLANIDALERLFRIQLGLFYYVGTGIIYHNINFLIFVSFVVVLFVISYVLLLKTYHKTITSSPKEKRKEFNQSIAKENSIDISLFKKELKKLLSSTTYLLNCGIGSIILIGLGIASFFFKNEILLALEEFRMLIDVDKILPLGILLASSMILSMCYVSTPAVSLEGNTYWISRSLPIQTSKILRSKRNLELFTSIIPSSIFVLCLSLNLLGNNYQMMAMVLVTNLGLCLLFSNVHLMIGVLTGKLEWTSEVVVIKQSFGVMIDAFGGWIFTLILGGVYFFLRNSVSVDNYLIVLFVLFIVLYGFIDKWIDAKGSTLFEKL